MSRKTRQLDRNDARWAMPKSPLTQLRHMKPGQHFWRVGELWELELVNETRARIRAVDRKRARTFTTAEGEKVTIESMLTLDVSPDATYELEEA
jgi:hypothetical protein